LNVSYLALVYLPT